MKELCSMFLSLLRYVPHIIDDKTEIHRFLSCFPIMFKELIKYDNPKMIEEVARKENFSFDQNKNKRENIPAWKNKMPNNFDPKKKENTFHKNSGNNYRGYKGNNYKTIKPQNSVVREPSNVPNKNSAQKEPLNCWECGGTH